MSMIAIRDLSAAKELDQRAMTEVKGGLSPHYPKYPRYPGHVSYVDASKWTNQFQSAQVNNTAVGIGGPNQFTQVGSIKQTQVA